MSLTRKRWALLGVLAAVTGALALVLLPSPPWQASQPTDSPQRRVPDLQGSPTWTITELTQSMHPKRGFVNNDTTLYFSQRVGDVYQLFQVSMAPQYPEEPRPVPSPFKDVYLSDLSPDGSQLLVHNRSGNQEPELWILPLRGGAPIRLGSVTAHDAAWSVANGRIAYASGSDLFVIKPDDSGLLQLAHTEGTPIHPRWSPDGSVIRFTVEGVPSKSTSLWEVKPDATNLHQLFAGWRGSVPVCCGDWANGDAEYFFFEAAIEGKSSIWAVPTHGEPQDPRLWHFESSVPPLHQPRRGRPLPDLLLTADVDAIELLHLNPVTGKLVPASTFRGRGRPRGVFTDGGFYSSPLRGEDEFLDIRTPSGSESYDLGKYPQCPSPVYVTLSPDGKNLAFVARSPARSVSQIYLIPRPKGQYEPIPNDGKDQEDPEWSPDGRWLAFTEFYDLNRKSSLKLIEVATKRVSEVPNSQGMRSESWSHDGHYLAAIGRGRVFVFDRVAGSWTEVPADADPEAPLAWLPDRNCLYFAGYDSNERQPRKLRIMRYCVANRRADPLVTQDSLKASHIRIDYLGITKTGELLVYRPATSQEICKIHPVYIY